MRQLNRYLMKKRGEFVNPFRTRKTIVASYVKDGREYKLHPTKGWRSTKMPSLEIEPSDEGVTLKIL